MKYIYWGGFYFFLIIVNLYGVENKNKDFVDCVFAGGSTCEVVNDFEYIEMNSTNAKILGIAFDNSVVKKTDILIENYDNDCDITNPSTGCFGIDYITLPDISAGGNSEAKKNEYNYSLTIVNKSGSYFYGGSDFVAGCGGTFNACKTDSFINLSNNYQYDSNNAVVNPYYANGIFNFTLVIEENSTTNGIYIENDLNRSSSINIYVDGIVEDGIHIINTKYPLDVRPPLEENIVTFAKPEVYISETAEINGSVKLESDDSVLVLYSKKEKNVIDFEIDNVKCDTYSTVAECKEKNNDTVEVNGIVELNSTIKNVENFVVDAFSTLSFGNDFDELNSLNGADFVANIGSIILLDKNLDNLKSYKQQSGYLKIKVGSGSITTEEGINISNTVIELDFSDVNSMGETVIFTANSENGIEVDSNTRYKYYDPKYRVDVNYVEDTVNLQENASVSLTNTDMCSFVNCSNSENKVVADYLQYMIDNGSYNNELQNDIADLLSYNDSYINANIGYLKPVDNAYLKNFDSELLYNYLSMVYDRASTALFQRSFSSNVSLAFEKKEGKLINEITKEINVWFMGGVFNNSAYLDYDDKTVMNSNMFVLGADYLSNNLIMGFAFGYSSEELSEIDNSFFNYLGDSYFLSLYLGKMIDYGLMNFYGITSLSYMGSFADIERKAIGFADSYNSFDYIDNALNFKLEVGSVFNLDKMFFSINPYLGLGVDYYNQDNYTEDGESYTMEVKGNNFVDSNIVIGNKIFYDFLIDTNVIVKPIIDISLKRSFKDNGYTASKFSDDNSNYYMYNKDANFEKFSFNYSFGISYIKKNFEVSLYYANKIYSVNSTELNDASFRFKFVYSL
jgi:hypothetical protein